MIEEDMDFVHLRQGFSLRHFQELQGKAKSLGIHLDPKGFKGLRSQGKVLKSLFGLIWL